MSDAPLDWHPCRDGVAPLVDALTEVRNIDRDGGLHWRLPEVWSRPSFRMRVKMGRRTREGLRTGPRERLRRWLQFHRRPDIAREIDERCIGLTHRLEAWENDSHAMLLRTLGTLPPARETAEGLVITFRDDVEEKIFGDSFDLCDHIGDDLAQEMGEIAEEACDLTNYLEDLAEWLNDEIGPAQPLLAPQPTSKEPLTGVQRKILECLDGVGLTLESLEKTTGHSRNTLLEHLKDLRAIGLVENKRKVGYYRPDSPPK